MKVKDYQYDYKFLYELSGSGSYLAELLQCKATTQDPVTGTISSEDQDPVFVTTAENQAMKPEIVTCQIREWTPSKPQLKP